MTEVVASCPLNTGIIPPGTPQAQTPSKGNRKAGAAQCDEALTFPTRVHPTVDLLLFQHPRCSLLNTEVTAQGLSFLSPSIFPSQQLPQRCDPNSCPGGRKSMVSTEPTLTVMVWTMEKFHLISSFCSRGVQGSALSGFKCVSCH